MALILPGGVNKGRRYRSLYEKVTVKFFEIGVIRAVVDGAGGIKAAKVKTKIW